MNKVVCKRFSKIRVWNLLIGNTNWDETPKFRIRVHHKIGEKKKIKVDAIGYHT